MGCKLEMVIAGEKGRRGKGEIVQVDVAIVDDIEPGKLVYNLYST